MLAFWDWPLTIVAVLLFAVMVGAYEVGIRLHARLKGVADQKRSGSSDEGFILSGVLGLLALLMAFAFSMSLGRYEDRRALMVAEANAIGSFDLIVGAAREPISTELRRQLRPYAQARLLASLSEGSKLEDARRQVAAARSSLEARVRQAMRLHEDGPTAIAIGQSFDDLTDVATSREALRAAHLPERVLGLLAVYCAVSAGMLGYAVASERSRHRVASATLFLLLAFAFATILDLDRPRSGAITISQEPLRQAVESLSTLP